MQSYKTDTCVKENQNLVPNKAFFEIALIAPVIANEILYRKSSKFS